MIYYIFVTLIFLFAGVAVSAITYGEILSRRESKINFDRVRVNKSSVAIAKQPEESIEPNKESVIKALKSI